MAAIPSCLTPLWGRKDSEHSIHQVLAFLTFVSLFHGLTFPSASLFFPPSASLYWAERQRRKLSRALQELWSNILGRLGQLWWRCTGSLCLFQILAIKQVDSYLPLILWLYHYLVIRLYRLHMRQAPLLFSQTHLQGPHSTILEHTPHRCSEGKNSEWVLK